MHSIKTNEMKIEELKPLKILLSENILENKKSVNGNMEESWMKLRDVNKRKKPRPIQIINKYKKYTIIIRE